MTTYFTSRVKLRLVGFIALALTLLRISPTLAAGPVARVVLFYTPTCAHCHQVMTEVLPPLQAQYGAQMALYAVDAAQPNGQALYQAAITAFAIPEARQGVPTLVIGATVLVGSEEISAQLPGLLAAALAAGGNAWPAIPGLTPDLAADSATPTQAAVSPFQRDPVGNSLALLLLLGMTVSVFLLGVNVRPPFTPLRPPWHEWAIPLLALVGLAVATYLAVIELSDAKAFCGPVGDCNTVQQSPYAHLFGVLPIGVLGVMGYITLLGAWATQRFGAGRAAHFATIALPTLALLGTLFSLYLTFLEPFVIGATCLWCLTSAAVITALLWLTVPRHAPPVQRGKLHQRRSR